MFERAKDELMRAHQALIALHRASDEREFIARFNDFIAAAQLVLIAVLREGRGERLPGFEEWYERRLRGVTDEDALAIVREARDYDFDDGPHRLRFVSGVTDEMGRPVSDDAWSTLSSSPNLHVALDHAPLRVADHKLERSDPLTVAQAIVDCLQELVEEVGLAVRLAESRR